MCRPGAGGSYTDIAIPSGVGAQSRSSLGFGCVFFDADLDGNLDLLAVNGHIDETVRNISGNVGYAQSPCLFLNDGHSRFRDIAGQAGSGFAFPRVARGAAYADFDRDGDIDVLITTNQGRPFLYRNDLNNGNRSIRVRLTGTKSNRDGIGAVVRLFTGGVAQSRMVKTGSSYLSQPELPVTFGIGKRDGAERLVVEWPSGRVEEHKKLRPGAYDCVEGQGIKPAGA